MTATRRLAAILAADVSGYPPLWASMRALTNASNVFNSRDRSCRVAIPMDR
jgi:class 3 adenylate cyclase